MCQQYWTGIDISCIYREEEGEGEDVPLVPIQEEQSAALNTSAFQVSKLATVVFLRIQVNPLNFSAYSWFALRTRMHTFF
jgi:hypothetical protein